MNLRLKERQPSIQQIRQAREIGASTNSKERAIGHSSPISRSRSMVHIPPANGQMQRILIIGSSGAGKSMLARHLGSRLSLPVIHLDNYFWHPGWVGTPKPEWENIVQELIAHEQWIIDGNYRGTLGLRLKAADTVIFLDLPRWICTFRAIKRRVQYRNQPRPDMAPGCQERLFDIFTLRFLRRIWDYPNRALPEVESHLHSLPPSKLVFRLRKPVDVRKFVAESYAYNHFYMTSLATS